MFRLQPSHVFRNDFNSLQSAVEALEANPAVGLELSSNHVATFRSFIHKSPSDQPLFDRWDFSGTTFADDCNFSGCDFRNALFEGAVFGDEADFSASVCTRAQL